MKKLIAFFTLLILVNAFTELKAQCTCNQQYNGGGYYTSAPTQQYQQPVQYYQQQVQDVYYNQNGSSNPYLQNQGYYTQPYTYNASYQQSSNLSYNVDYQQNGYSNQQVYYNQQPQQSFGQKVTRVVQVINAFGQIANILVEIFPSRRQY